MKSKSQKGGKHNIALQFYWSLYAVTEAQGYCQLIITPTDWQFGMIFRGVLPHDKSKIRQSILKVMGCWNGHYQWFRQNNFHIPVTFSIANMDFSSANKLEDEQHCRQTIWKIVEGKNSYRHLEDFWRKKIQTGIWKIFEGKEFRHMGDSDRHLEDSWRKKIQTDVWKIFEGKRI